MYTFTKYLNILAVSIILFSTKKKVVTNHQNFIDDIKTQKLGNLPKKKC